MSRSSLLVLPVVAALSAGAALWVGVPAASARSSRAETLYHDAQRALGRNTWEWRRVAIRELEQATLLDGSNSTYELLLARTYLECGFLHLARQRFERASRLAPDDPDVHLGLAQVWRRDWLKYLERPSLDHSIDEFYEVARLRPAATDGWLQLVPLLIERGEVPAALDAALRAEESDPLLAEAALAHAHAAYRSGDLRAADSLFRLAVPRLPTIVRERFDDISPVATDRDTAVLHRLAPEEQRVFIARFWRENDPDLSSPENEALLEYWSRVAQAYFLFFDRHRREWDERGEVYVRYGAPRYAVYNPVGDPLAMRFGTGPVYPANSLVWVYPELGMFVRMQDRLLSEYYLLPIRMDRSEDPMPMPDSLAHLQDRMVAASGRAVFSKLPPGVSPLEVQAGVARFLTDRGPRLVARIESPGSPDDTLWAQWAVIGPDGHEVTRGERTLTPSPCDPTERRVADFAADLPSGTYSVGLSVHAGGSRRGVYHTRVELPSALPRLALSDVVVACGSPPSPESGPEVRVELNPGARVDPSKPLTAYFEIYHLTPDSQGESRFEYVCTVKSADKDPRIWIQRVFTPRPKVPEISVSRETPTPGTLRRQYVSVPIQSLPPGSYRLEIKVRDRVAGGEATSSAVFEKPTALKD